MKVFVTGATGYIGSHVAQAFRRGGHEVWGLTRSEAKAAELARREIRPVIGSMQQPESFRAAAEAASVLVHAAVDYEAADSFGLDRSTVEALIAAGDAGARDKLLLYTSGVWVHGDTGGRRVDESTPLAPAEQVASRPQIEELVLDADSVRGLVIRPGCVYGERGGMFGVWFEAMEKGGPVRVVGDGANRWTVIHAQDLSRAYVMAAELEAAGEVFDVVDDSSATVGEMVRAAAGAAGYEGEIAWWPVAEARQRMGAFAECLALDQRVDNGRARRLLGWEPRLRGFTDDVDAYYAAWKALRG